MAMYQSNVLKVCDYVTLYLKDATKSGDVVDPGTPADDTISLYRWDIPQSAYMSNQRSQVCTVELTNGVIDKDNDSIVESPVAVQYVNGGYNQHASFGKPVIAVSQYDALIGTGALLCQARPQHIEIKILTTERAEIKNVDNLRACFTLKYSYYDAVGTGRDMQHEKTISL
jgi:hypothetical protein